MKCHTCTEGFWDHMWVSQDHKNEGVWARGLKPLKCSLSQFWGWRPNSRCRQGHASFQGSGEVLPSSSGFWQFVSVPPVSASSSQGISPVCQGVPRALSWRHLSSHIMALYPNRISTLLITAAMTLCPNKITFGDHQDYSINVSFWRGHKWNP